MNQVQTKGQIFLASLKLFAVKGYENVSMREIAEEVGVKAASIYNHFSSKEDILNACYNYYLEHRYDLRPTERQYEELLKSGTKEQLICAINYPFREDIILLVFHSFLIVFSRVYTDDRAREIYASEVNNSLAYLNRFFKRGVELGRMEAFNFGAVSSIFLSARLFTATLAVLGPGPDDRERIRAQELDIFNELIRIVPFKY